VEHATVALSTYLAVVKFNDGDISFLKIFEDFKIFEDIKPGSFTAQGCQDCDQSRIELSAKKSKETVKSRRKTLRHLRKKRKKVWFMKLGAFNTFQGTLTLKQTFRFNFLIFAISQVSSIFVTL
jgi:hypothetical protein